MRIVTSSVSLVLLIALLVRPLAAATDHTGKVTLSGGTPVPGARVTATQGSTTLTTTTDVQGAYRLPGLADGTWTIEVAMVGFSPQRRDVTVGTGAAAATWELSIMPFAEITRGITVPPPAPPLDRRRPVQRNEGRASGAGAVAGDAFQRAGVAASAAGAAIRLPRRLPLRPPRRLPPAAEPHRRLRPRPTRQTRSSSAVQRIPVPRSRRLATRLVQRAFASSVLRSRWMAQPPRGMHDRSH